MTTTTICSWCLRESGSELIAALTAGMSHGICQRHLDHLYPSRPRAAFRALARLFSLRRWSLTTAAGYVGLGYCVGVSAARWL